MSAWCCDKWMDCSFEVNAIEIHSFYYVYFLTNTHGIGMKLPKPQLV